VQCETAVVHVLSSDNRLLFDCLFVCELESRTALHYLQLRSQYTALGNVHRLTWAELHGMTTLC